MEEPHEMLFQIYNTDLIKFSKKKTTVIFEPLMNANYTPAANPSATKRQLDPAVNYKNTNLDPTRYIMKLCCSESIFFLKKVSANFYLNDCLELKTLPSPSKGLWFYRKVYLWQLPSECRRPVQNIAMQFAFS